jgi:hypothetical protein
MTAAGVIVTIFIYAKSKPSVSSSENSVIKYPPVHTKI